jgi:photosystem II stability/assembly factor-like uncharacterized protein
LAGDQVLSVVLAGRSVWAGTSGGLSRSDDGGTTWKNFTAAEGLAGTRIRAVAADDGRVAAALETAVAVSDDNGATWTNYTGFGAGVVTGVALGGGQVYCAVRGTGVWVSPPLR